MARTVWFWVGLSVWTLCIGVLLLVANLLTLGLLRRRLIAGFARLWGRPALWLAGVRAEVHGREHVVGRAPRVLVMNHTSTLDLFAGCLVAAPGTVPVGKIELWRTPVLGQMFALAGFAFVDRHDHDGAMARIHALAQRVRRERLTVFMAPEGTRSETGALQPFHLGAFVIAREGGVPVVPVVVHGAARCLPARAWTVRPGTIRVDVQPPRAIPPDADLATWVRALHDDYARWLAEE